MSYSTEIERLKAEAPAIMRAALEKGECRKMPTVDHRCGRPAGQRGPRSDRAHPEFAHMPPDLYKRNAQNKISALKHGREFELLTKLPAPRRGEVRLKEWITDQAEKRGLNIRVAWMRFCRGKMKPKRIRRVTKRTIFVRP